METQKYFKLLNRDENHHGFQFKTGLNVDNIPFDSGKERECVPGGIYFSKSQDILSWLDVGHESVWIREVTIPEDAKIIEFKDKLRADKIILGDRMSMADVETWKYLVDQGANIHANDDYAFRWAAQNGHLDTVKYLVDQGADVHANMDCAFRWAADRGYLDTVKYLVDHGADIHADNECAFRWAASNGHLDVAKYLVSQGTNIHARNDYALRWADRSGHIDVVKYLKSL